MLGGSQFLDSTISAAPSIHMAWVLPCKAQMMMTEAFVVPSSWLLCPPHQFSSVQSNRTDSVCPALCNPMNCSMPGFPVQHQLPELTQIHVHWVSDAIQLSHPLLPPSPALKLPQHQGLFKWVSSSHQVAKVLEFQLQHQSFQWIFRTDFL